VSKKRMIRVPTELLQRLREQNPELKDVSDTDLINILLRRMLTSGQTQREIMVDLE